MYLSRSWRQGAAGTVLLAAMASQAYSAEVLPKPEQPFAGVIDPGRAKSKPDWPKPVAASKGAPNIVLILLDDVGFGAGSVTGGPISTPALDKLAADGLRYNQFHVNEMCSPTRASLLSGRNQHQVGFGTIAEWASGYPGYNSVWPKSAASVAEVLRRNGYSTAAFGKWHNTPVWEISASGPFDHWPTSLGFEYFYGFNGAATSQWEPRLWRNTTPVEPSSTPVQGYHLTTDLADDAIHWLHEHDATVPDKPFFVYFATGATHEPHQVAKEWIDKFKGQFDEGWDKLREKAFERQKALGVIPANAELTPRPDGLAAWDSLSADQKKLLARQAEVYAGFLAQTDYEIGRVLDAIREEGKQDNTLVLYVAGDNGASAEGGPEGHDFIGPDGKPLPLSARVARSSELGGDAILNHHASAWAWAFTSPLKWSKRVASHLGGTTDPLIVSWPAKIADKGAIRGGFHHVTDIAPTIYEAAGVKAPDEVDGVKQLPLEGESFVDSFTNADAKSRHTVQYFEKLGSRGIYKDGWWAGAFNSLPWGGPQPVEVRNTPWELYNLDQDYSQAHDLAAKNPEKLKELVELFDNEAKRNNVYPLLPQPSLAAQDGRKHFVYHNGVTRVSPFFTPKFARDAHTITAEIEVPGKGAQGVIITQGGKWGGFSLYLDASGHAVYETSSTGNLTGRIASPDPVPAGKATITLEYVPDSAKDVEAEKSAFFGARSGKAKLSVNSKPAGETNVTSFPLWSSEGLDIGEDLGTAVSANYSIPYKYTGAIRTVTVDINSGS